MGDARVRLVPLPPVTAVEQTTTFSPRAVSRATAPGDAPQRVLFTRPMGPVDQVRSYAPFPDGQRFLLLTAATAPAPQQLTVRVNWRSS